MLDMKFNADSEHSVKASGGLIQGLTLLMLFGAGIQAIARRDWPKGRRSPSEGRPRKCLAPSPIMAFGRYPRLEAYGFSGPAYDRYIVDASRRRKGRGVVKAFTPLPDTIMRGLTIFKEISDHNPPLDQRRTLLRKTAIGPLIVEGLSRGARDDIQTAGVRSASAEAEDIVSDIMAMSPESVHQHCNSVRRNRKSTGLRTLTLPEVAPGFFRALILPQDDEGRYTTGNDN